MADFVDGNGKQAVLQLPASQLLLAAANISEDCAGSKNNLSSGWLARTHRFYLVLEINERRTSAQKELQDVYFKNHKSAQEGLQAAGSKRARSMDVPSGGHIPLPQHRASGGGVGNERKKSHVSKRRSSGRQRVAHSLVADGVVMSALRPFTSGNFSCNEEGISGFLTV